MQKKLLASRSKTQKYAPVLTPEACEKCGAEFRECTNKVQAKKRTYHLCCACMGDIRKLLSLSYDRTVLVFMRAKKDA